MWFFYVLGIIIALIINAVIANKFVEIADMKGHYGSDYFWYIFLFGIIGTLMVIALPDISGKKKKEIFPETALNMIYIPQAKIHTRARMSRLVNLNTEKEVRPLRPQPLARILSAVSTAPSKERVITEERADRATLVRFARLPFETSCPRHFWTESVSFKEVIKSGTNLKIIENKSESEGVTFPNRYTSLSLVITSLKQENQQITQAIIAPAPSP